MTAPLTAVSLFAGVGGIDLALERAGVEVVAAVEKDKAARGVLADRFPNATLFPDVTEVTADDLRAAGFVPRRGVVTAGWPCQGNSVAGRRKGLADPRSGLWAHVVRLLGDLRPAWFLGENVPGLLSVTDGEDFGRVLQDLADLGMGFAYRVLDAQHFGVPQRRRRVFLVGCAGDDRRPVQVLLEPEGSGGDPAAGVAAREGAAGAAADGVEVIGGADGIANCVTAREGKGPDSDATTTLVVSALTQSGVGTCGPDDNQAQAGHLIPALTASMGSNNAAPGDGGKDQMVVVQPLAVRGRDGGAQIEVGPEGGPSNAVRTPGGGSSHAMVAVTATGEHSHTLTGEGHDASEDGTGRGTPIIAAAVASGGHPNSNAPGRRKEDDVNLVAFQPQAGGDSAMSIGETSPCLSVGQVAGVHTATTVRRLTPRECERLQGFPDDWTATSNGKRQADSPRYKQMGNAVAVPCVEWIARRIVATDGAA